MARLRELLYADPSPGAWDALCAHFDNWGPEGLDVGVDYAEPLLREWPTWLREAPSSWNWGEPQRRLAHDLGAGEYASLRAEERIVWCEDLEPLDYVRQRWVATPRPRGRVRTRSTDRVVGYAELEGPSAQGASPVLHRRRVHAQNPRRIRRVFTLRDYDRDSDPDGVQADHAPAEAVDPRTVAPGVMGWKTGRLRGRTQGPGSAVTRALSDHGRAWDDCVRCGLHARRCHVVTGSGAGRRRVAIVGAAPSADDDARGLAFVGRAHRLIALMLDTMGLTRHDALLTYLVACRANRFPRQTELNACAPRLQGELDIVDAEIVVALGEQVARTLLGKADSELLVRGKWHNLRGAFVMPTLSLERALDTPRERYLLWGDLKAVRAKLDADPAR